MGVRVARLRRWALQGLVTPEWARRRMSRHSAVTAPAACPGSTGRSLRGPVARRLVVDQVASAPSLLRCRALWQRLCVGMLQGTPQPQLLSPRMCVSSVCSSCEAE